MADSRSLDALLIINDWAHISRKWTEGAFAKRMHNRLGNEGFLKLCLDDLRRAPTEVAFDGLAKTVLAVWTVIGEGDFAVYFKKMYLNDKWKHWYLGATPPGVGSGGQQLIENSHNGDKLVLGKTALRASPKTFLESSLEKILRRAGKKLDKHQPSKVSHKGKAPMTGTLVYQAQCMLETTPAFFKFEEEIDGKKFYAMNVDGDDRKMSSTRALKFGKYYDDGELPKSMATGKEEYKRAHHEILKCCLVTSTPVSSARGLSFWAQNAGCMYSSDEAGQLWNLSCSCFDFSHSNNRCVQVVALAAALNFVDLGTLLDGALPRRGVGRPRLDRGAMVVSDGRAAPRSAAQLLAAIRSSPSLRFHNHNVVTQHGSDWWVGHVRSLRTDGESRFYVITYPDDKSDERHELTDVELSVAMHKAQEVGKSGVWSGANSRV